MLAANDSHNRMTGRQDAWDLAEEGGQRKGRGRTRGNSSIWLRHGRPQLDLLRLLQQQRGRVALVT